MSHRQPNEWSNVFLDMAFAIAKRSKDNSSQCGAIIVDRDNVILSCGFNGPPSSFNDELVPWNKRPEKYSYILHAEENALWFATEHHGNKVNGSTLYVTHYPCPECVLRLIRSKVSKVIIPNQHKSYQLNAFKIVESQVLIDCQAFPKLDIQTVDYATKESS